MDVSATATLEQTTLRKVYLRRVPYCFLLYILCYVDRINVSFAALTMNRDIGLTAYVYGLAAGAFFWGYCLLEVAFLAVAVHLPDRTGARGRSRADQFAWQFLRLSGADRGRLHQGSHRQFRSGTLCACRGGRRLDADRAGLQPVDAAHRHAHGIAAGGRVDRRM